MNIGKVAKVLGALVIVGLLIFAVISLIIPNVFTYITCVFKSILNPDGSSAGLGACANAIEFKFK